jgi:hypothetical protein
MHQPVAQWGSRNQAVLGIMDKKMVKWAGPVAAGPGQPPNDFRWVL